MLLKGPLGQLAFGIAVDFYIGPDIYLFLDDLAGRLEGQALEKIPDIPQFRVRQAQGSLDFLPLPLEKIIIMLF